MLYRVPRCQVVPLADHQVSIQIDGVERLRWHFGPNYPRPYFYPLVGPSGQTLTRMGHPGAPNHDHHRSAWFAHEKVLGINFWGDATPARIRQQEWLVYDDGDEAATLAVRLGWYDGHDPRELLQQDVIATVRPLGRHGDTGKLDELAIDLQSAFVPKAERLEIGRTNFGFLAVRVAKSLSEHFGGGTLTSSRGQTGEPAIFARPAEWVDYSGPVPAAGPADEPPIDGITYFDHPGNPGFPNRWHVRADGWMGCSPCMEKPLLTTQSEPLSLRYCLHVHAGPVDSKRAAAVATEFAARPMLRVVRSRRPHRQYELEQRPA